MQNRPHKARLALAGESACPLFPACEVHATAPSPRLSGWRGAGARWRAGICRLMFGMSRSHPTRLASLADPPPLGEGEASEWRGPQSEVHLQAVQPADV